MIFKKHTSSFLCLLFFIILAIGSSEDSSEQSTAPTVADKQKKFELRRNEFFKKYDQAPNDIKKSSIWNDTNDWTKTWAENNEWEIDNWYGVVDELSTDQGGDVLSLGVNSDYSGIQINYKTWSNRFSDSSDNTMPSRGGIIYNQSSELKVGDHVYFSAILIKDQKKGIKEISFTERGSLSNPEFIVKFTDIRSAEY